MPDRALKVIDEIHTQAPRLPRTNSMELLYVEMSAHLARNDPAGAEKTAMKVVEKYPSPSAFRAAVGPSTTRTDSALVRGAHTRKVVALFEGTAPSQGCHVTGRNLRTARLAENAGTDALPLSRPCSLPASARFLAYLPLPRCSSGLPSGMHGPRTSVTVGRCVAPGSTSPCSR